MSANTNNIQQLYVAYFGRPADATGLAYWETVVAAANGNTSAVSAAFSASPEYNAAFAGLTNDQVVNTIYNNLFHRDAEPAGLTYWSNLLTAGKITISNVVTQVAGGAQGTDAVALAQKVAASVAFTAALDTTSEILSYSGTAANTIVKEWLAGVFDASTEAAAVATINDTIALLPVVANGQNFALTTGVDTIIGTPNNDTINAVNTTPTSVVLGGLDTVDGGGGVDTLNIQDAGAATFSFNGVKVQNVELFNITSNGNFAALDLTGYTGLTTATLKSASAGASDVTAGNSTNVNLTVTGVATANVYGGKAIDITAGTGAVTVGIAGALATKADGITKVAVHGGGVVAIDNTGGANGIVTGVGTTLTAVTLDGIGGATAGISGAAIDTVTVKNQATALATTITNANSAALTVNVDNAGYDALGAAVAGVTVAAGSAAKTISLNATGAKSNVSVSGAAVKTLNITGSAALTLATPVTTATKIDGSAATGNLNLGTLNAATVTALTGAGADKFTLSAIAAATVNSGAGNDIVTLGAALAAGSTVALGDGNDTLLGTIVVAASTPGNTTHIDGGAGTDAVSSALINAGNAAQFVNFETLSLQGGTVLDASLITGSTITSLSVDAASSGTYSGITTSQSLTDTFVGNNSANTTTLTFTGVGGTNDSYSINFAAAPAAAAAVAADVQLGTIAAAGIENFNIVSGGTNHWNSLTLGADTSANKVTITGDSNLDLTFAGFGSVAAPNTGVSLIDGSAATGKLAINTAGVTAATAGLSVLGGSGADTITLAGKTTVNTGAGNDTIHSSATAGTFTGGAGADTFDIQAAVTGSASNTPTVTAVITDAAAGDKIQFGAGEINFNNTAVNVGAATNLAQAFGLASTAAAAAHTIEHFVWGTDTYLVDSIAVGTGTLTATDVVVKLTGLVDLTAGHASVAAGVVTLA